MLHSQPEVDAHFKTMSEHARDACTAPAADVILCTAMTVSVALDISDALGVPCWAIKLAPDSVAPTASFCPPAWPTSECGTLNLARHYKYWVDVGVASGK